MRRGSGAVSVAHPQPLILVVDDREENRSLLRRRLQRNGAQVVEAADGASALRVVAEEQPDLVLLDHMMPGMSGLDVLKTLRLEHDPAALPVIMVTAYSEEETIVACLEAGANDFVGKPIAFRVLSARMTTHLALKGAIGRLAAMNTELEARVEERTAALRQQSAQLMEARDCAEEANRAKSQFLANMSHEIRTPLNGVLGMTSVLETTRLSDEQRRMLGAIQSSGDQLLSVINDILDVSKIEAGRMEIETATFSVGELVDKLQSVHGCRASEKGLRLNVETTGVADAWLRGDPHRILQILHNLVSNALKFTASGAVSVSIDVSQDGRLTLEVADTGAGMTRQQVERVFDVFVQADSSISRRYGGSGLGMSIVRRLAQLMDGDVAIDSEPDVGTVVRVSLRLALSAPRETCAQAPDDGLTPAGLRVLAADDNEINRMVIAAMLQEISVDVVVADSGRAAVAEARRSRFDAILLDISMPDVDGVAALKMIRADEAARGAPSVPAIAITANALTHQTDLYIAEGFDRCVPKPFRSSDLAATLVDVVRRHAPA